MGRVKEINRKPVKGRKRKSVVYIICEGTETEIRYFKRFRSRGCPIDIIPISSQYKAADRLVQKVKATMGMNPYYPDEGDASKESVSLFKFLVKISQEAAHPAVADR